MPGTVQQGAKNAIVDCLGVGLADRVVIIGDAGTAKIDQALVETARGVAGEARLIYLEDFGPRPFTTMPAGLADTLAANRPTVTVYAAQGQPGEIAFRIALLPYLTQVLKVRHGHMIGIDERLMREGMCADYRQIAVVTNRVFETVHDARSIEVTSLKGSRLTASFDPSLRWKQCTGLFHRQGEWGNLPEGEVFTSPARLEGTLVADLLGDYFSSRYGVLANPVTFTVVNSRVVKVECADATLGDEVWRYLKSTENGDRAGEFAIGTNTGLAGLTGNLLQDEKIPGVHVAFGNPYPDETGADWRSTVHVDVIPVGCNIVVDGRAIMSNGQFLPEVTSA